MLILILRRFQQPNNPANSLLLFALRYSVPEEFVLCVPAQVELALHTPQVEILLGVRALLRAVGIRVTTTTA